MVPLLAEWRRSCSRRCGHARPSATSCSWTLSAMSSRIAGSSEKGAQRPSGTRSWLRACSTSTNGVAPPGGRPPSLQPAPRCTPASAT
eukprot:6273265-Lingulodinium_polyedra.AAC.1